MARELKVWGGRFYISGQRTARAIIAARSRAEAARVLAQFHPRNAVGEIRDYWSVTGNEAEIAAATAQPLTLLVCENRQLAPAAENYAPFQPRKS